MAPYVVAEVQAETARAKTAWGTISLTLDPDVDASAEYEASSGASGSVIGDAGHGDVEFGVLNPTAKDATSGSYGTLRVLKKTIGVSTTGKYYTVYLSMSKKDINNAANNNALNLVTSTDNGGTVATDSSINLPPVTGTFDNPTALSGPSWGFAVPNAKTTGNISSAGNFLTSYYTDTEINVSSTATGASDTYTNSLWAAVPTADSPVQIWKQETTNPTGFEDDTFDIYYAVAVDTNTLAGTYENNVVYTAVANTAAIDKVSSNLQRDKAYGGAGDILTINFDLTNSTAFLEEDNITITLVPHDVMMANNYSDETNINLAAIKANNTNLNCPVVANSLDLLTGSATEVSTGKTTSVQCTVPEGSVEDGTGVGTYDILLTIDGYNYDYVSVYQYGSSNSLVGTFIYAGLQSMYANAAAGATYPDVRYVANTPIITKMQEMTAGVCASTSQWGSNWSNGVSSGNGALGAVVLGNNYEAYFTSALPNVTDGSGADGKIIKASEVGSKGQIGTTGDYDLGTYALTDVRDGKRYAVRRLADGNCWMVQNLDLDLYVGMTFTSDDTDLNSKDTWEIDDDATYAPWRQAHRTKMNLVKYSYDSGDWALDEEYKCEDGSDTNPCYIIGAPTISNSAAYYKINADGTVTSVTNAIALADGFYDETTTTDPDTGEEIVTRTGNITKGREAGVYGYRLTYTLYRTDGGLNGDYYSATTIGSCSEYISSEGTSATAGMQLAENSPVCGVTYPAGSKTVVTQRLSMSRNLVYSGNTGLGTAVPKLLAEDGSAIEISDVTVNTSAAGYNTSGGSFGHYEWAFPYVHSYDYGPRLSIATAKEITAYSSESSLASIVNVACDNTNYNYSIGITTGTLTDSTNGQPFQFVSCGTYVTVGGESQFTPAADTIFMGNYYNYYAITAGYGDVAFKHSEDSICPAGWQLPAGSGEKSYQNLLLDNTNAYGGNATNWNIPYFSAPLSLIFSGTYGDAHYTSSTYWAQSYTAHVNNYWANDGMRMLLGRYANSVKNENISVSRQTANGSNASRNQKAGNSLRCVAR